MSLIVNWLSRVFDSSNVREREESPPNLLRILVCSDSHGMANVEGGPTWVERMARQLPGAEVVNLSLGGSTTGHWVGSTPYNYVGFPYIANVYDEHLKPWLPTADIVLLAFGANDMWLTPIGTTQANLTTFRNKVAQDSPARVLPCLPLQQATFGAPGYPTTWGFFNLAAVAGNLAVIRQLFVDSYDPLLGESLESGPGFTPLVPGDFGPPDGDHLHMSNSGHRKVYKSRLQEVKSYFPA